jgi:hypothetical protein
MTQKHAVLTAAIAAALALAALVWSVPLIKQDACLDSGGIWSNGRCMTNDSEMSDMVTALLREAAQVRVNTAKAMLNALTEGDPDVWEPTPEKISHWQAELEEAKAELTEFEG